MAIDVTVQPSAERAVRALERATAAAEGKPLVGDLGEIVLVSRNDLEVLPVDVLRLALDRVLMGPSPEHGLDSLLDTGVLPSRKLKASSSFALLFTRKRARFVVLNGLSAG